MKRILLTITVILMIAISANAQDLFLSWEGETLADTLTVWGEPDSSEIVFHAVVHNNSDKWMKIKVRRNQLEMVDSTSSYFCWGSCFEEDVEESPSSIQIVSGGSSVDTAFSGHYLPNNKIGTSWVEYMFFNPDNEDQFVKVVVKYWASPESITEDMMKGGNISDLYPNPAKTSVSFDYEIPIVVKSARIQIVNIFGSIVKVADIERNAHQLTMDISGLNGGIYFVSVLIDGHLYKTKKLLIQKN